MRTKEEILDKNGFDFEAFKIENEYSAKNLLLAMDEYSEQNCDANYNLFDRPAQKLNPLEDLYRKENPSPDGRYYTPDRTKFYEWITRKILNSQTLKTMRTIKIKLQIDNVDMVTTYTEQEYRSFKEKLRLDPLILALDTMWDEINNHEDLKDNPLAR